MSELLRGFVRSSVRLGQTIVSQYASGNRTYEVRILRPHSNPVFNRATGAMTNPPDELIYRGPARVRPTAGGGSSEFGDEPVYFASAVISVDEYAGFQPRRNDLVEILADDTSTGTRIAGRLFKVDDVEVGGLLDVGVVMQTTGVAPHRRNQ